MTSVPRPAPQRSLNVLVVSTVVALALAGVLVWSVVKFAAQNPDKANLGAPVFRVGSTSRLSREIAERGPFLFQDPLSLGRGRNLYIQHLGKDPDKGWSAIEARLPGDEACAVTWVRSRGAFVDCRAETHPPDGAGLTTYPATVANGQVSVDLRTGSDDGTTSTNPGTETSSTTAPEDVNGRRPPDPTQR